ncbi:MAG: arginase family protein [Hyphomicrobiaceae bacterium]
MPARLIHRYGTADRPLRGFEAATLADVRAGIAVLFGLTDFRSQAQAVRDASWYTSPPGKESKGLDLGDADADCGRVCAAIRQRSGRPILVGGTLTQAVEVARAEAVETVVLFSARLDLPSHLLAGKKLVAIGSHDLLSAATVRRWRDAGGTIVASTGAAPLPERMAAAIGTAPLGRTTCIMDADVIDTGFAAGSHGLNVGGVTPLEFLAAVQAVTAQSAVDGVAIANLAPDRDSRGHSELLFAEAIDMVVGSLTADAPS